MRFTTSLAEPVVVLLTNSPAKSQKLFSKLFSAKPLPLESHKKFGNDKLSQTFKSHSASSMDGEGCIFHFLSLRDTKENVSISTHHLSLLSILDIEEKCANSNTSIQHARDLLATRIEKSTSSFILRLKLMFFNLIDRTITAEDLLGMNDVQVERKSITMEGQSSFTKNESENTTCAKNLLNPKYLKEIVLPYDPDHSSMMARLETLNCSVIKPGLYKFGNLAIRPLPICSIDINLSPPTLVFRCQSLDQIEKDLCTDNNLDSGLLIKLHKVGRNSTNQGQLLIGSNAFDGNLELRYCETASYSSFFAEAQASLMASSLEDLQNVNVLLEGGQVKNTDSKIMDKQDQHTSKLDTMNGLGDCWKEFRVNIQRPRGFLKGSKYKRVAKAPDIPFE
jgi:hypothetical protein